MAELKFAEICWTRSSGVGVPLALVGALLVLEVSLLELVALDGEDDVGGDVAVVEAAEGSVTSTEVEQPATVNARAASAATVRRRGRRLFT